METAASLAWLDFHQAGATGSGSRMASRAFRAPWPTIAGFPCPMAHFFTLIVSPVTVQVIPHVAGARPRVPVTKLPGVEQIDAQVLWTTIWTMR